MAELRRNREWRTFVSEIGEGRLAPFVGDWTSNPDRETFLREWAQEIEYPFQDGHGMARLAQFLSVSLNDTAARRQFLDFARERVKCPDFEQLPDHPLMRLAKLNLPLYVTTSYYDFLEKALEFAGKNPRTEISYWRDNLKPVSEQTSEADFRAALLDSLTENYSVEELRTLAFKLDIDYEDLPGQDRVGKTTLARELIANLTRRKRLPDLMAKVEEERPDIHWDDSLNNLTEKDIGREAPGIVRIPSTYEEEPDYEPSPENPLVYHLYGLEAYPSSLVLTEDDYLDFLVRISQDFDTIPPRVRRYFTTSSIMLLGYKLQNWDFKALFRGVVKTMPNFGQLNLAIQIDPVEEESSILSVEDAQDYLERYFERADFWIYWGKSDDFMDELQSRLGEGA
jgi:hypothetical protein